MSFFEKSLTTLELPAVLGTGADTLLGIDIK